MNCKQNQKINQKNSSLVVRIDIGGIAHYARAFEWRGGKPTGHYLVIQ